MPFAYRRWRDPCCAPDDGGPSSLDDLAPSPENEKHVSTTQQHLDPPVSVSLDHVRGKADARLTLVEYGDFQCPACIGAYGEVHRLEREFGDDLRVVFRHFPLTEMHPVGF